MNLCPNCYFFLFLSITWQWILEVWFSVSFWEGRFVLLFGLVFTVSWVIVFPIFLNFWDWFYGTASSLEKVSCEPEKVCPAVAEMDHSTEVKCVRLGDSCSNFLYPCWYCLAVLSITDSGYQNVCNCWIVYFSFQFLCFLLHVF